jgi:hypothetical protein
LGPTDDDDDDPNNPRYDPFGYNRFGMPVSGSF